MKSSDLSTKLRELADRVDSFNVPTDHECTIDIGVRGVSTREDLAKWRVFAGNPIAVSTSDKNAWLRRYTHSISHEANFGICVFFTPGLLGGERREIVIDSEAGLAELMAEHPAEAYRDTVSHSSGLFPVPAVKPAGAT